MNRKLQHTLKALSATAAVFTVLLLAGGPAVPAPPAAAAHVPDSAIADTDIVDVAIDASEAPQHDASQRRRLRHSRELLALPYFSFAQGLRRTRS